jgi:D-alanyl-D-alanine carboxypeptidase (penicillin-binding protein 5/6)
VVMGADSELHRFAETKKLFNYGFSTYSMKTFLPENQTIAGYEEAPVIKGKSKKVKAITKEPVRYPVKYGEEEGYKLKAQLNEVNAPVQKGQQVGGVMITTSEGKTDEFLRPVDEQQAGGILVAEKDVDEAGWLRLAFRSFFGFFGDIFSSIGSAIKGWFS